VADAAVAADADAVPTLGRRLGAGGEAEVYEVRDRRQEAYKRYRQPTPERAAKLRVMVAHPPAQAEEMGGHVAIAWPRTLSSADGRTIDGFVMPSVDLTRAVPLFQVYNPQSRSHVAPGFTWRYLLRTARNVAAIVASLHDAGYVIGDLNESNFLVTDRALVVLVDCDSMQVRDPETGAVHRGAVGKPEFLAPEFHGVDLARTDRTVESDRFALGVLVFLLLMEGLHPFAGVWRGRGEPPDIPARIRARHFPYRRWPRPGARLRPPPLGLRVGILPAPVRVLTHTAFTAGVARPGRRPSAREWARALEAAEARLRECSRSPQHVFGRVRRCPWCARVDAGLPDPFPAADGTVVTRRVPSRVAQAARAARRATRRWIAARFSVRARASGGVVAALVVMAWFVPVAGLALALVVFPAAARLVDGGPGELNWWRWRALARRARLVRAGVASSLGRMHWTAAAATAGAGAAAFLVGLDPWSSGRAAAAAATLVHTLLNLRQ